MGHRKIYQTWMVHLWASRGYDYFRDEMYFIVCRQRLDWGFVDQPPLIPAVAAGDASSVPRLAGDAAAVAGAGARGDDRSCGSDRTVARWRRVGATVAALAY